MRKILFLVVSVLMIFACKSTMQIPAWKDAAFRHLENYKMNFLAGKEDATEPHFLKARKELAAGNDLNLMSIAYLTKYGLHTASLESFDTSDFAKLYRLEPNPANMAYCHFLKGNFSAVDLNLLPKRYVDVMKAVPGKDMTSAARAIAAIDDPLSRLIACGVWVHYLPCDENILQIAITTSSANGWKRPMWAYLGKLQAYYQERGDFNRAYMIRDRLELIKKQTLFSERRKNII